MLIAGEMPGLDEGAGGHGHIEFNGTLVSLLLAGRFVRDTGQKLAGYGGYWEEALVHLAARKPVGWVLAVVPLVFGVVLLLFGWSVLRAAFVPISAVVGPPLIEECSYHLECRLMSEIDLPTGSLLVIGEIMEAHADEEVLDETGTNVSVAEMDPLCYITGIREYWSLGEKVADAYSIGKSLSLE